MEVKAGDIVTIKAKVVEVRIMAEDTIYKLQTDKGVLFNDTILVRDKEIVDVVQRGEQ